MTTPPRPTISVCIANYNGGGLVLECLASVYAQSVDAEVEVLVHDDASTDDSLQRIVDAFPSARVIPAVANVGFCISNNRMADAASGQYLLLLNNDAVLRSGSLAALMTFARSRPDSILGLPQHAMADGSLVDVGYCTDPFLNPIPLTSAGPHEVGVATGACLWIPRTVWKATGGFPPFFESVAEDIYLCLAARCLGFQVFVLGEPGFDHVIGQHLGGGKVVAGALRTSARRRRLSERNKTYAMLICYPAWLLCLLMPLHALLLASEVLLLLMSGTAMRTVKHIYTGLPGSLWQRRHDLKALRLRLAKGNQNAVGMFRFTYWWPQKLAMLLRHGRPHIT